MFSIYSTDKTKCYEVIKKLSDIYLSDKEYLKVRHFKGVIGTFLWCFFSYTPMHLCVWTVGKGLVAAHSAERGRGC